MADLCSCHPHTVLLHQPGSYCGDAQHEAVTAAITRMANTADWATRGEWMERLASAALDALRPPARCAVEGCGQDPLRDGRCLQHVAPMTVRYATGWDGLPGGGHA